MRIALVILFLVLWFLNSPVLQRIYNVTEYYGYIEFVATRFKVYEFMFLILSLVCFMALSGFAKAVSCFTVIMIVGSLADKLFLGVTGYVLADIILIVVGLIVSVYVYRRSLGSDKKPGS